MKNCKHVALEWKISERTVNDLCRKGKDLEMRSDGIKRILKLGIAFSGKKVKIRTE